MESISNFSQLPPLLAQRGIRRRVVAVCPRDASSIEAINRATAAGFVEVTAVDDESPVAAAERAVAMVRAGEADILMKGLLSSDTLLHAILNRDHGLLRQGHILTHIAIAEMASYRKLLFYSDPAVIPYPTQAQRIRQVEYMSGLCHTIGVARPRISLIHCSEKVNEKFFPYTLGYAEIRQMTKAGAFGDCIVDGPLDVKTSLNVDALRTKKIVSPIDGDADGLVFPDIVSANAFHKTISLFAGAEIASLLQGSVVPIVLPSRGDSGVSKFYSLALASLIQP